MLISLLFISSAPGLATIGDVQFALIRIETVRLYLSVYNEMAFDFLSAAVN